MVVAFSFNSSESPCEFPYVQLCRSAIVQVLIVISPTAGGYNLGRARISTGEHNPDRELLKRRRMSGTGSSEGSDDDERKRKGREEVREGEERVYIVGI